MRLPWHVIGRNNHSASSGSAMSVACQPRASPHEDIRSSVSTSTTRSSVCFARGTAPIVEQRIGELTAEVVAAGLLTVTHDPRVAVLASDVSIVCVGTPSARGGGLATAYLEKVSDEIGAALAEKSGWHTVVYRSTMLPGTCENVLIPILERSSGKRVGVDFGVCVNPEFLREGTSVADFFEPPKTVVGQSDARSGDVVTDLYDGLPGPRFRVALGVAEMAKYVDNGFHAFKVEFANEIGTICGALGMDSHEVMEVFHADTKLNIRAAYLRPGFAFGGSCLPKDVRALIQAARRKDVEVPVLSHVLASNEFTSGVPWTRSRDLGDAGSGSSACRSRQARTTSAKARSWSSLNGSSARAASSRSTIRTSRSPAFWAPTRHTSRSAFRTLQTSLSMTHAR